MLRKTTKYIIYMMVTLYSLSAYSSCLKEGDKVRLSGVVSEKLYYGPPGWGEDKKKDKKLHEWILHLNKKLTCVNDANTDKLDWSQDIQLIMRDNNAYEKKKDYLGANVSVEGIVLLAETGYHMTSILLDEADFITSDK